jgi:hypothetical protein
LLYYSEACWVQWTVSLQLLAVAVVNLSIAGTIMAEGETDMAGAVKNMATAVGNLSSTTTEQLGRTS